MTRAITRLCRFLTTTCFAGKTQAGVNGAQAGYGETFVALNIKTIVPAGYSVVASLVFLDSLRFKFTNAPETQTIFGKLDAWAATLGAGGLFAQTGVFSQYVIGSAELLASGFLLASLVPRLRRLRVIGALIAVAVMSGAVSFHLFTPLGIDPNNDGGGLFAMAVVVWLSSIAMLVAGRETLARLAGAVLQTLVPPRPDATAPRPLNS